MSVTVTAPAVPPTAEAGILGYIGWATGGGCPESESYVGIGNVIGDIGGLGVSTKMADITPHGPNVTPYTYEFPTVSTFGPVTFDVTYVDTLAQLGPTSGLAAAAAGQQLKNWVFVWPDGNQWLWSAYLSKFEVKAMHQGICQATITLSSFGPPFLA